MKEITKKVCRICHTDAYQGEKARLCIQQITGKHS